MEDLKAGEIEYKSAREFLTGLKRKFGEGNEEAIKMAELKQIEQRGRTMEEFI